MGKGDYLGEFEQQVLLAVIRRKGNAYGVTVRREISERTNRNIPVTGIRLVPAVSVVPGSIGNNTNGIVTIISGIR